MIEEDIRDLEERLEELENALCALHLIERGPDPRWPEGRFSQSRTRPLLPDRPPMRTPNLWPQVH